MVNEKFLKIPIVKYDEMFDSWLEETLAYSDYNIIQKVMAKFDESLGIIHDEAPFSQVDDLDDDCYNFRVVDDKKFFLAIFKYELYNK